MLLTMGCGDECPYVPGLRREDWPLLDPKGRSLEETRAIRDEIQHRVLDLLHNESLLPTPSPHESPSAPRAQHPSGRPHQS
jgi:arsenate reductase